MRPLSPEEEEAWGRNDTERKIAVARKHAHDPAE